MTPSEVGPRRDKRGRLVCDCGGYHFPHRKGGGACHHSPRADYYAALSAGVPEHEALQLLWADKLENMNGPNTRTAGALKPA